MPAAVAVNVVEPTVVAPILRLAFVACTKVPVPPQVVAIVNPPAAVMLFVRPVPVLLTVMLEKMVVFPLIDCEAPEKV